MKKNNLSKKILAGVMSLSMFGFIPFSAGALDSQIDTNSAGYSNTLLQGQEMQVIYTKNGDYTLKIPSHVTFNNAGKASATITAEKMNLKNGNILELSIASGITGQDGSMKLTGGANESSSVTTVVTEDSEAAKAVKNGTVIARFGGKGLSPMEGGSLYFSAVKEWANNDGLNIEAGTYKGTLTFSVQVGTAKSV